MGMGAGGGGAYVTFRMTLAGHTGLLPHQFYSCPTGHHLSLSFSLPFSHTHFMFLSQNNIGTHPPDVAATHTHTLRVI